MEIGLWLVEATRFIRSWEESWGDFDRHPSVEIDEKEVREAYEEFTQRLKGNYPFFHPRYAGQMLKPPHPIAALGYATAMLINPNNHALDGGPPSSQMEKEVVRELAAMFHFPDESLGHLTTSGTIANLEALWVARNIHPDRSVAFSQESHYTHGRMAGIIGMDTVVVPADHHGRMRLEALEEVLQTGEVGTVVFTTGTTALGAVDPVADAVPLCRRYGARVHIDAAYGGYFALHAWSDTSELLTPDTAKHFRAVSEADSIVVDPHKHGLQPYGCGCILLRDPAWGRYYKHDSPYTYFVSEDLHLGEISLECSRAGAAAAALWLTLKVLPLTPDRGMGPVLAACLHAARRWSKALGSATELRSYVQPELDIVTYFPERSTTSAMDRASQSLFEYAMTMDDPVFLSVLSVESNRISRLVPDIAQDTQRVRILRSVLMRPEQEFSSGLVSRLDAIAQGL